MKEIGLEPGEVVGLFRPERSGGLLGLVGRKGARVARQEGVEAFVLEERDGTLWLGEALRGGERGEIEGKRIVVIRAAPQPIELAFVAAHRDDDGHDWDLILSGTWKVTDPQAFFTACAGGHLVPGTTRGEAWIRTKILAAVGPLVRDEVRKHAIEALRERDVLPARWWETKVGEWLRPMGMGFRLEPPARWESADAERAEEERRRREALEALEAEERRAREAELRMRAREAAYEEEKARIESECRTSKADHEHALALLERKRLKEMIEADAEIEEARLRAHQRILQIEAAVERTEAEREAVRRERERLRREGERLAEEARKRSEVLARLERGDSLGLLARLAGVGSGGTHQAAEALTEEIDVPARILDALGFRVFPQLLVDAFREKAARGRRLTVKKAAVATRDIGNKRVEILRLNDSLRFTITADRAGHATVLNIGTSGTVYLHVPNAWVDPNAARVEAARRYEIPGSGLLPWEGLRREGLDYLEVGPAGWEHIAVIVSARPIIPPAVCARSTPEAPIVRLDRADLEEILGSLDALPDDAWDVGMASFKVVE